MYTTHHPAWDAKNRHGLPDELPLDYSRIAHIFSQPISAGAPQQTPTMQTQPTQAATAPQPTEQPPAAASVPEQVPTAPVQQPAHPANTSLQSELNPNIPRSLRDLMVQHGVQEYEIQAVVSQKGYYPQDTPIPNYDPGFIEGVLVAAWPQVFEMIQVTRSNIPFS